MLPARRPALRWQCQDTPVPVQDRFSGFQNAPLFDNPPFTMKTQSISRRQFLKTGTAATIAATTPARLFAAGEYGGNKITFGLPLYSVRDETGKDLGGTVAPVVRKGCKAVQVCGYCNPS